MLTRFIVVTVSQYIQISNYYYVQLELIICLLYLNTKRDSRKIPSPDPLVSGLWQKIPQGTSDLQE